MSAQDNRRFQCEMTVAHSGEGCDTAYTKAASVIYDRDTNRSFAYGDLTLRFLKQIVLFDQDKTILDIGCGTGLAFEILRRHLEQGVQGVGVDPSDSMLKRARLKFRDPSNPRFLVGSFESLPLADSSVDRIVSSLALHWSRSIKHAAVEMKRVLKDTGRIDILLVAGDDATVFRKPVFTALKKHLKRREMTKAIHLAQRLDAPQLESAFAVFHDAFKMRLVKWKQVFYGTFKEHMNWWLARSAAIISNVTDKEAFFHDLQEQFNRIATSQGIPLDTSCFLVQLYPEKKTEQKRRPPAQARQRVRRQQTLQHDAVVP